MIKNDPLEVPIGISDDEYRQCVERQQVAIYRAAAKIQAGEPLDAMERGIVTTILLNAADGMPVEQPQNGPGNPNRKIPHDVVAILPIYIEQCGSKRKAIAQLAETYDCSETALKKYLRNHQDQVAAWQAFYDSE